MKISSSPWGALLTVLIIFGACSDGGSGSSASEEAASSPSAEASPTPEEPTLEEFVAQADEICTNTAETLIAVNKQYAKTKTKEDVAKLDDDTVAAIQERLERLQELTAPSDFAADYDRYVEARAEAADIVEKRVAALRAKENQKVKAFDARSEKVQVDYKKAGRNIGFFACAERMDLKAMKEVEKNLVEFFTEVSPKVAQALVSEQLLETYKGPEGVLEGLQASPRVSIRKIEGVSGVRAEAEILASIYGKRALVATLVYEDGTYKIDSYGPKE